MKRLVVLLVAVAAAVALAGLYLPSDAATVGGATVSRQSLDSDLSAIAGSPDYTCFLSEERQLASRRPVPFLGAGTPNAKGGVYDATFVDDWLGSMITDQVAARVVARRGLSATAGDLSVARGVLERRMNQVLDQYARDVGSPAAGCGGSAQAVLSSLPRWFVAQQTTAGADQDLLDAHAAGAGLSGAAVAAYFARHQRSFDRDCLDVVVVRSRAAAAKVETALGHGTSFAKEAQAASVTSSSASSGGAIGCGVLGMTTLGAAVAKLAVHGVTRPIRDARLYLVLRLASRSTVSLGAVRSRVVTAIIDAGQARADAELTAAIRSGAVGVDPRYGSPSRHPLTLVLPAPSPPPGAELSASANIPALTTASA
jgi:hypothetical protein